MPEIKNTFTQGKMNKDLDERIVPNGQYRDAMNIQVSTSEGSDVGTVQNILGNNEIGVGVVGGGWECVGSIADEKNDVLYSFIAHSNRNAIIEYAKDPNDGTISVNPVLVDMNNGVLNFEQGDIITGINIIDDLLLWTDGTNEPKKINIQRCKDGTLEFFIHTKLIVGSEKVLEKEIQVVVSVASTNQPAATNIIEFSDTSGLEVGDQLISLQTSGGGIWNFITSPSAGPQLRYITDITGDVVTLNDIIFTGGTANWIAGGQAVFHHHTDIAEEHITVIKKKPLRPLSVKINPADINTIPSDKDPLFEKIFPRFSYRYRYEDGEYSAFAPFTDVVFNSKYPIDTNNSAGVAYDENTAYNTKEPYNFGMRNMIKSVELTGFNSPDMPEDVVQVDILYKQENSTVIYVVEIIKNTDDEWGFLFPNSDYKGKYEVKSENIYAALPENQLLRPWDNVPKTALAQEITGNRLVYGNYTQSYDLGIGTDNKLISPRVFSDYELRFDGYKNETYYTYEVNLLSNSDFAINPTTGPTWSLSTDHVHWNNSNENVDFYYDDPSIGIGPATQYKKLNQDYNNFGPIGTTYKISFEVSDWVSGNIDGRITNGTKNVDFDPTLTAAHAIMTPAGTYIGGGDFAIFNVDLVNAPVKNKVWEIIVTLGNHVDNIISTSFNGRVYIESAVNNNFEGTIDNFTVQEQIIDTTLKTFKDGGFPSVKSQRNYQLGVVYGDKYGRETPVFTSSESSIVIPWEDSTSVTPISNLDYPLASFSLQLNARLGSYHPDWADYYKFFVKETSGEYYNLIMDAMYNPTKSDLQTEEHVWLSFASSERNKISEDDYIILKKRFSTNPAIHSQVSEENKFRVLDVQNEAPDAVKYKYEKFGEIINDTTSYTAGSTGIATAYGDLNANILPLPDKRPIITGNNAEPKEIRIHRTNWLAREGQHLTEAATPWSPEKDLYFSFTKSIPGANDNQSSEKYKISTLRYATPYYIIKLAKKITDKDSKLAENDVAGTPFGFADGDLDNNLTIRIEKKLTKDLESFSGRFFVKIATNNLIKSELENIERFEIMYNYEVEAYQDVSYHADNNVSIGWDITSGLVNNDSSGAEDYTNDPSSVHNIVSDITSTEPAWQGLLDEMGSDRWFIDKMYMVASQTSDGAVHHPGHWARRATQGWHGGEYNTPGDLKCGYNVPSGYSMAPFSTGAAARLNWPGQNQIYPGDPGSTVGQNLINGLEGVVTTGSNHVDTDGIRRWENINWQIGNSATVRTQDDTYGSTSGEYYLHISYLAPGDNLHSGNLSCDDNELEEGSGFTNTKDIMNQQQSIHGGGVFTWGTAQHPYHYKALMEMGPQGTAGGIGVNGGIAGYNPGSTGQHQVKHDNQWSLPAVDQSFVSKMHPGSKFRFTNDPEKTIYNIISSNYLEPKKVYNHTPWRKVWTQVTSISSNGGHPLTGTALNNSVEEAVVKWKKDGKNAIDVPDIKERLFNFGNKNNRRLTYILKLDKDPSASTSYNPVDGSNIDSANPAGIEFITEDFELNSGEISQNATIWETEPKDNVDLDIYYEAGQAYPITLTEENRELLAPVGCEVFVNDVSGGTLVEWQPANNGLDMLVSTGFDFEDVNGTVIDYNGEWVKFVKEDGSYTTAKFSSMTMINDTGATYRTVFTIQANQMPTATMGLSWYNCFSFGNGVESDRIRDDFNGMTITNGVRANMTLDRPYTEEHRKSGMIYSGLYNSISGVNNLNQFIMAEKITKDLNPTYGSIQKLYSRVIRQSSSLIAFCEDKIVSIISNKNALYNADGNPQIVASNAVLGDANAFVGDYGISQNPESFAKDSYRAYFTDKQRGAVLRLSMDGLTPISDAGMSDWFKDEFKNPGYNFIGSFDNYKNDYNLTLDDGSQAYPGSKTITYSEDVKGWVSFKSFIQESGVSMSGDYYTFKGGKCYKHDNTNRNTFYGTATDSSITFLLNESPLVIKNYNTLNYDGEEGWVCDSIATDQESGTIDEFIEKEGKWFNYIKGDGSAPLDTKAFNFQGIGIASNIEYNI